MNRDPHLPINQPRNFSRQSANKFFYLVDAIAKDHEPTATQLEALERSYMSTGEYLTTCPEFQHYLHQVHAQGSRPIGTIIRPTHIRAEGFDIDLVARLSGAAESRYEGEHGPVLLLNHLFTALQRYATQHGLEIQKWERCVTLKYKGGMHADIAAVIDDPLIGVPYGSTHARIPDRKLHLYDPTNPIGLAASFNDAAKISPLFNTSVSFAEDRAFAKADLVPLPDANEVLDRLLCRLVQLLKLHRNVSFGAPQEGQDFSPRSAFVTALAAAAYTDLARIPHQGPLDLLLDIVYSMPSYFQRNQLPNGCEEWLLPNPAAPGDNLASGMNTPERQRAFGFWHSRLKEHLERLVGSIVRQDGFDATYRIVQTAFGERAALAVRELNVPKTQAPTLRRNVVFGAVATGLASAPARGHNFYGS